MPESGGDSIEWIERGWPLRADGSCDPTSASEQGVVAMSAGLAEIDRKLRDDIFSAWGGAWNVFGEQPFEEARWPAAFPGSLVLRREARLRGPLGRDLVLALLEWRREATGRRFLRCVWFILPADWSERPQPAQIGAACVRLLAHRGRPARAVDTPAVVLDAADTATIYAPTLTLAPGASMVRAQEPSTPDGLMMALVGHAMGLPGMSRRLAAGLAVFCSPTIDKAIGLGIPPDADQLLLDWQHPLPAGHLGPARDAPSPITASPLVSIVEPRDPRTLRADRLIADGHPDHRLARRVSRLVILTGILLGLHVLQFAFNLVLWLREGDAPAVALSPPPGLVPLTEESDPATTESVMQATSDRLLLTEGDGLAVIDISTTGDSVDPWTTTERQILDALADGEPLVVVGFAEEADCELADLAALRRAEAAARALAETPHVEVIVVGRRAASPPPLPPHEALIGETLIIRRSAAGPWRALALTACPSRSPRRPVGRAGR